MRDRRPGAVARSTACLHRVVCLVLFAALPLAWPAAAAAETGPGARAAAEDAQRTLASLAADGHLRFEVWAADRDGSASPNHLVGTYSAKRMFGEGPPMHTSVAVPPFHVDAIDTVDPDTGWPNPCLSVVTAFTFPPFETERRSRYLVFRYPDPATRFRPPYRVDWSAVERIESQPMRVRIVNNALARDPMLAFVAHDDAQKATIERVFATLHAACAPDALPDPG